MTKYLDELKKEYLKGKKVFFRADLDVPIEDGKIGETFRIKAQKGTLDYLVNNEAKVLMAAHLGHEVSGASFGPILEEIGEILGQTLTLVPHSELTEIDNLFKAANVLLLDNLRQDKREMENDDRFAAELSEGFDFYVNNDFAVMHREHASVVAIAKRLPSYAGLLVKKEIENLSKAVSSPAEGKVLILGGAKISTKLPVIKNFLGKAEKILIGGAVANNFFKAKGINVGDSLVDDSVTANVKNNKIILPEDIIISATGEGGKEARPYPVKDVGSGHYIPDIGPETARHYAELVREAKMVIWNGSMGKFEIDAFAEGTRVVAEAVAAAPKSLVGGGDTIAAADRFGLLDKFSFVSTGGGAMLEFLAGNKLPGLEALGYR